MLKLLCFTFLSLLALGLRAESPSHQSLDGVSLSSTKKGSIRYYTGKKEAVLPYGIEFVKLATVNFGNRCNNDLRSKRRFTTKSSSCGHHNEHLIESFVDKVLPAKPPESEAFLLARQIYNRGHFGYYELVTIQESHDQKNLRKIVINLRMLSDSEVKEISSPKFSQESAFRKTLGTFVLTELTPDSTHLSYSYSSETDHWLINKEVSVPRVFSSIGRSINDLLHAIEDEARLRKKEQDEKEAAEK